MNNTLMITIKIRNKHAVHIKISNKNSIKMKNLRQKYAILGVKHFWLFLLGFY